MRKTDWSFLACCATLAVGCVYSGFENVDGKSAVGGKTSSGAASATGGSLRTGGTQAVVGGSAAGGSSPMGGSAALGGTGAVGGSTLGSGGSAAIGGTSTAIAGTTSPVGGATNTGGSQSTSIGGGANVGGAPMTGGASAIGTGGTGGSSNITSAHTGGIAGAGGTTAIAGTGGTVGAAGSATANACQITPRTGVCEIGGSCHLDGETKTDDKCLACNITSSISDWTLQPEGSPCGEYMSCQASTCRACGNIGQTCCGSSTKSCSLGAVCDSDSNTCIADQALDISGGIDTFCAMFKSGRVRCWGTSGLKLGINVSAGSNVAAPPVAGLKDAVSLSVGYQGVCAARVGGGVVCWGNPVGTGNNSTPVNVSGISNATQVSVGYQHACVRTADMKAWCWGDNSDGQFGNGTKTSSVTPIQIPSIGDVQKVAACGNATCVLTTDGQVACSGKESSNGQSTPYVWMTGVTTAANSIGLSCTNTLAKSGYFCAVSQTGTLTCWGFDSSQRGFAPTAVTNAGQALAASADQRSFFVIQQDHSLRALGANGTGQLGNGTLSRPTDYVSPQLVHFGTPVGNVVAVATIPLPYNDLCSTACLVLEDGSVNCAGYSLYLGDGQSAPAADRPFFVPVAGTYPAASESSQCFDGLDNDGNGKTDTADPNCALDLGSATGNPVATVTLGGLFGNYFITSCNLSATATFPANNVDTMLTWTAPSDGKFQFDTNGSSYDTMLTAFMGNPQTANELVCNDDGAGVVNHASSIQLPVVTGDKITLLVDSKTTLSTSASFTLNITQVF